MSNMLLTYRLEACHYYAEALMLAQTIDTLSYKLQLVESVTTIQLSHLPPSQIVKWLACSLTQADHYQNRDKLLALQASVKDHLTETAFAQAQAQGQAMSLDTLLQEMRESINS